MYPLPNQPRINMAAAGAGAVAGEGSPEVAAPVVICNENLLTVKFNPGTVAGQKIFLKKGLVTAE